jgi:hypothetical protein
MESMKLRMPLEHGAWGLLLVPMTSAAVLCAAWNLPLLLCILTAITLFLLRGSLDANLTYVKPPPSLWEAFLLPAHLVLAAVSFAGGTLLLIRYQRSQLLPLAFAGAVLFLLQQRIIAAHNQERTEKRSLLAEMVGVVLLSLVVPAVWIAAAGRINVLCIQLWLLNIAFFLGGVLYVKFRVRGLLAKRQFGAWGERLQFAWPVFVYHALLLFLLVSLVWFHSLSVFVMLAFVPGILRAGALLRELGARFPIKRLGWTEVAHSLIFAILLLIALK